MTATVAFAQKGEHPPSAPPPPPSAVIAKVTAAKKVFVSDAGAETYFVHDIYCVGIFAAAKMTHLRRDKTATKMGHPIFVAWSDVATQPKDEAKATAGPSTPLKMTTKTRALRMTAKTRG
jgi:hypothetical protein